MDIVKFIIMGIVMNFINIIKDNINFKIIKEIINFKITRDFISYKIINYFIKHAIKFSQVLLFVI